MGKVEELRKRLEDAFSAQDAESLARLLADEESSRIEARHLLHRAITESPNLNSARLLLAKLYYLDSMTEFCIRELLELLRRSGSPSVRKLIESFGPVALEFGNPTHVSSATEESIVGELDLDFDEAEDELES